MPSRDPEVNKRARDKWYKNNKKKQIGRQVVRRKELATWFVEHKRTLKCEKCGMPFKEHPECCDFHHKDSKTKRSAQLRRIVNYGKKALLLEIFKCIPLCANCHRILHFGKKEFKGR